MRWRAVGNAQRDASGTPSKAAPAPRSTLKALCKLREARSLRGLEADDWSRLLYPCRERPRSRRTAEQRYERAPVQLIELYSIPASRGRIA
jgi:hypothetical protein